MLWNKSIPVLPTATYDLDNESLQDTESLDSHHEYQGFYLQAQFVTGLICYPIICFFGLTGNFLSIVVLSQKKMQTSTNTYLLTMAVSDSIKLLNDTLYFLVILLLNIDPEVGQNAYGYLYPYAHYFFNMSVLITAWLTVSVAAERYIMVCHATRARDICNVKRARITSAIMFIFMGTLTIPMGLRYKTVVVYDNVTNTTIMDVEVTKLWQDATFATIYTWIQNLLRSVIPLLILCTFNFFIVLTLRRTRSMKRKISSRHRITWMLISVIIVFMVCVTPDAIISTFFGFGYYEANFLVRGVREVTDLLLTINSAVNFVLYCTFNKLFRKHFMSLFCWRHCKKDSSLRSKKTENQHSSFTTFKGTVLNGSNKRDQPLCENIDADEAEM